MKIAPAENTARRQTKKAKFAPAKKAKSAKKKQPRNPNIPTQFDWRTTDEQEIARRRQRALDDPPAIKNLQPGFRVFSDFEVRSSSGMTYFVEIRDLAARDFYSTSSDFQHNGLGTCKHTEAVLVHLETRFPRIFKKAMKEGSPRVDLVLDSAGGTQGLRLNLYGNSRPRNLARFFDKKGVWLGKYEPEVAVAAMESAGDETYRVSREVHAWLSRKDSDRERVVLQRDYEQKVHSGEFPAYETTVPLYPYQREGMLFLAFRERALLADEMGLGKTIQAIAASALLHRMGKAQRCLIVAPASLKAEWEEQIAKFTSLTCNLVFGNRSKRTAIYSNPEAFFTITNYEQIRADSLDINTHLQPDIVILDEAQRIKNWASKTARAVKRLESRYAFVLTGTPIENRIDELYSIVDFLDPGVFGPLFRFNRDFYKLDDRGRPAGYKNLEKLRKRVKPLMLRRRKAEVETELPQRTVSTRLVQLTPAQRMEHDDLREKVVRLVAKTKHRPLTKEEQEMLMLMLGKMLMICDTLYILDPAVKDCPKLVEIATILEEALAEPDTKVIIFSEWVRMLELVRTHLADEGIGYAWHVGEVPQKKRRAEIRMFKDDPDCRVFLCSECGGVGLNLQKRLVRDQLRFALESGQAGATHRARLAQGAGPSGDGGEPSGRSDDRGGDAIYPEK